MEPNETTEKFVLGSNPQDAQKRGCPKKTWKKTIKEEASEVEKALRKVLTMANN
jgi:hypothetical protein